MKTLSLLQPWATLVAIGAKKFETRSWRTSYRGPLLIHASKRFTLSDRELCSEWPFNEYLEPYNLGYSVKGKNQLLPLGAIVGSVDLVDCITTGSWLTRYSTSESESTQEEYRFGNYGPDRFAWELRNPVALDVPIRVKGSLGIWEFDESALGHLAAERE